MLKLFKLRRLVIQIQVVVMVCQEPFVSSEELPMTMQVGMVGKNGIVLASDLKWNGDAGGQRESHYASKIKLCEERGIAVACSESEVSLNIASAIIDGFKQDDHLSPIPAIERIAKDAMRRFDEPVFIRSGNIRPQSHCLVVLKGKPGKLFSLKVGPEGQNCSEELQKRRAGDPGNPAMFFVESYYTSRPVEQLVFLAAHVVLMAAHFNSGGIGSIKILVCDKSGFRMLPPDEIERLKSNSNALDGMLRASLESIY